MKPCEAIFDLFVGFLIFSFWILTAAEGGDRSDQNLISDRPPKEIVASKGDEVRFTCKVRVPEHLHKEQLKVKWKHNGHYIHPHNKSEKYVSESKGQTLLIRHAEQSDEGVYMCIIYVGFSQDMASGRLTVREVPEAPKNVSILSCTGNVVELLWQAGKDGGAKIRHYLVQFNTSENPNNWNYYYDEIPGHVTTTRINLSPWGTYSFRLLANNDVGYSEPSKPTKTECTTPPERPGGNPKDVRTLTYKKGKLIVTWTPMPRLIHNGPGFKYAIFWRRKGSTYWNTNMVDSPNAKMWEVSVNTTYTLYEIKVKSHNQIGESRQPAFIYIGYSGEGEPTVTPKDFRLDSTKPVEPHRAHFIWEAVDTSEEKILGDFKGYKLRYWKSSEGRHKWKVVDIIITKADRHRPDVRAAIDDLPAYTALRAQVSVMNTHYTGPPSQTIDFFTPEGKPDPVRDLRIEAYGTSYTLLKWLPPEEPNGQLLGYDIGYQQITDKEKGPIKALRPQIHSPDTLGARITGLSSNHDYRFYVWARTNAGRGKAMYLDVKTEDGEPPDTPQPKFITLDDRSVNITLAKRLTHVKYISEYKRADKEHWNMANSEWGSSWLVINDLMPNTEYEVRVIAKNKFGDTAYSTFYRVKTQPRRGRDAVRDFQRDEGVTPTDSSSNIHQPLYLSLACVRTRTLVFQSIVTLVITYFLFH